jgi:hypothetical protein
VPGEIFLNRRTIRRAGTHLISGRNAVAAASSQREHEVTGNPVRRILPRRARVHSAEAAID